MRTDETECEEREREREGEGRGKSKREGDKREGRAVVNMKYL